MMAVDLDPFEAVTAADSEHHRGNRERWMLRKSLKRGFR